MGMRNFFIVLVSLGMLSAPIGAAPLEDTQKPQAQKPDATGGIRVLPAARAPAAGSLADSDGNGLSDGLETILEGKRPGETVNVIVTFSGPGSAASAQAAVGPFKVYREFSLISGFAGTMSANQARNLAGRPGVFRVEQDATAYASNETARRDFGVEALRANPTDPSSQDPTGAGVHVCVIDTGIMPNHEQFTEGGASRVVEFIDLIGDYNGVIQSVAYDDHGHGSHVSGTLGGDGTVGTAAGADPTLAPLSRGVAPGISLHVAKVLDYNGSGPDSGIIAAIEWCQSQNAHVYNLSLGIPGSSDGNDALSQAVNQAVAQGAVVVVAAGNGGDASKTIGSPGAAKDAITVGAVAEHSNSTLASAGSLGLYPGPFSSRGPTRDGRVKPDIAAPGVTILSSMSNIVANDPDPIFGGGGIVNLGCGVGCYIVISGTSMASPFVAGTAALMLAANPALSPAQVYQILADTAHERGVAGKDNVFGHGLVNVKAAVLAAKGMTGSPLVHPHNVFRKGSVADNGSVRIPVSVVDMTKPLAITVTIDGKMTRNGWSPDLELQLLDAAGQPFLIANPLYPFFSDEPVIPAPGTSSTCPAGEDCGLAGAQETLHIRPWAQDFMIEIFPYDGRTNRGKGGSFSVELSNGYFNEPLAAVAGADVTVADEDGDGFAEVTLDGRASTGHVTSYQWQGVKNATSAVATFTVPVGMHSFDLTVSDGTSPAVTDTVNVTVSAGGNSDGGGKKCNPRREVCS